MDVSLKLRAIDFAAYLQTSFSLGCNVSIHRVHSYVIRPLCLSNELLKPMLTGEKGQCHAKVRRSILFKLET